MTLQSVNWSSIAGSLVSRTTTHVLKPAECAVLASARDTNKARTTLVLTNNAASGKILKMKIIPNRTFLRTHWKEMILDNCVQVHMHVCFCIFKNHTDTDKHTGEKISPLS